jgi:hypothetical protein
MNFGVPGCLADAVDLDIGIAQRVQHVAERSAHQDNPHIASCAAASISVFRMRKSEVLPTPLGPTTFGPPGSLKRSSAVMIFMTRHSIALV